MKKEIIFNKESKKVFGFVQKGFHELCWVQPSVRSYNTSCAVEIMTRFSRMSLEAGETLISLVSGNISTFSVKICTFIFIPFLRQIT